jgi:hypothetical protein
LIPEESVMVIDAADLDPTSAYKLLIGSIIPRAIAWVSTLRSPIDTKRWPPSGSTTA